MILVLDDIHPVFYTHLSALPLAVMDGSKMKNESIFALLPHAKVLVVRSRFKLDASFLSLCKQLKVIARAGAGLDNIDLSITTERKIICLHASEGNCDAVAEHVLAMLLSLLNKIPSAQHSISQMHWEREAHRGKAISSLKIGIWGYGFNGEATADRFRALGATVFAYDKYKSIESKPGLVPANPDEIFKNCDALSMHVPLTEETKNMINTSFLQSFEKPIYFINAARGELVVWSDLVSAFENNRIIGLGLDVLPNEKPYTWPLLYQSQITKLIESKRAVFTPHVAGWTVESYFKIADTLGQKIKFALSQLNR